MRRAAQVGTAVSKPRRTPGTSAAPRSSQPDDGGGGTFLTSVEVENHLPTVHGTEARPSNDLEERLEALSQAIGHDGVKLLRGALLVEFGHVCRLAREEEKAEIMRQGQTTENSELKRMLNEEIQLKEAAQAGAEVLQEQLRMVGERTQELQSKNEALESRDAEMRRQLSNRDEEIISLKEQVKDAQLAARTEETEKLKVTDRLRRNEVEIAKATDTVDKLTTQLQHLGGERDSLRAQVQEMQTILHAERCNAEAKQQEAARCKTEVRVLRRNMQHQMPEEFRRVSQRVEQLEKTNRQLQDKLTRLQGSGGGEMGAVQEMVMRISELTVEKKSLEEKVQELKREMKSSEKKHKEDVSVQQQRVKRLLEQRVDTLQGKEKEEESRVTLKMRVERQETQLAQLRRRNTELLAQVSMLEDSKMAADKAAREAVSRGKEVQERLDLLSTLNKLELGRLQFSQPARTEEEVDRLFDLSASSTARHHSRPPSGAPFRAPSQPSSLVVSRPPSGKLHGSRPSSSSSAHSLPASVLSLAAASTASSSSALSRADTLVPAAPGQARAGVARPMKQRPASASRVVTRTRQPNESTGDGNQAPPDKEHVGMSQAATKGGRPRRRLMRPASADPATSPATHVPAWGAENLSSEKTGSHQDSLFTLWSEGVHPPTQKEDQTGQDGNLEGRLKELHVSLDQETSARIAAQEHVTVLAQQMLDKDRALRELRTNLLVKHSSPSRASASVGGGRQEQGARAKVVTLEAQNMQLFAKVRRLEKQVEDANEKAEECSSVAQAHGRRISELVSKLELAQEENSTLQGLLSLANPSYTPPPPVAALLPDDLSVKTQSKPAGTAKAEAQAVPKEDEGAGQEVKVDSHGLSEKRRLWNQHGLQALSRPPSEAMPRVGASDACGSDELRQHPSTADPTELSPQLSPIDQTGAGGQEKVIAAHEMLCDFLEESGVDGSVEIDDAPIFELYTPGADEEESRGKVSTEMEREAHANEDAVGDAGGEEAGENARREGAEKGASEARRMIQEAQRFAASIHEALPSAFEHQAVTEGAFSVPSDHNALSHDASPHSPASALGQA